MSFYRSAHLRKKPIRLHGWRHYTGRRSQPGRTGTMSSGPLAHVLRHIRKLAGAHSADGLTDRQLLERFAARREEAAFATLVDRHGPMVLGVCRRVLANPEDADDAFQATF